MAVTDGKRIDDQPVGAGLTGATKFFFVVLAAATLKTLNFGKYQLVDATNVHIVWGGSTNGVSDAIQGEPDTTKTIAADGKTMDLQDAAGGDFVVAISGIWKYK